jgi:lipoate-protein ligase A
MEWRLIVDPPAAGAWNMAVDEALAEAVEAGASPPVLRLYRWAPPCLSLGASQPWAVADAGFCAARGVAVVRRPTGGRAVLHQHELTYLVAAPLGQPPLGRELQGAYAAICAALVAGLRRLGVQAHLAGAMPGQELIRPTQAIPCFIGPAPGEIVVGDRKLVGSAMRRVGNSILQHGSILLDWDGELQAGCLGLADDGELRAAVVTLAEVLGAPPAQEALERAVRAGFEEVLGVALRASPLSAVEAGHAAVLQRARYASPAWTIERRREAGGAILPPFR